MKHFEDFVEDQFDFHSYCLRKVTLRSYVSLLRFEDAIYGQAFFCEAAAGIIRIYLHLHDMPTNGEDEEPDYSKMTAVEKKKAKAIARKKKKAIEKKEAELQAKKEENGTPKSNQKGGKPSAIDEDPFGKVHLKKVPIEEAKKFSAMLTKYAPKDLETWLLRYDVALRLQKPFMALQALFKAKAINEESSEVFSRIIDFESKMSGFSLSNELKILITEEAPALWENKSINTFILDAASAIKENPTTDLPMRTAVAKALIKSNSGSIGDACDIIIKGGINSKKVSFESCQVARSTLESFGDEATESVSVWIEIVQQVYSKF